MLHKADLPDHVRHSIGDYRRGEAEAACSGLEHILRGRDKIISSVRAKLKTYRGEPAGIHHVHVSHEDLPAAPEGEGRLLGGGAGSVTTY